MYYTFNNESETVTLEVENPKDASKKVVTLEVVRVPSLAKTTQGVVLDTLGTPWSREITDSFVVLTIPSFAVRDMKSYREELKMFFSQLQTDARQGQERVLIIDLRCNYGETPKATAEIFRYLIDRSLPFFADENPFDLGKWKRPLAAGSTVMPPETPNFQKQVSGCAIPLPFSRLP